MMLTRLIAILLVTLLSGQTFAESISQPKQVVWTGSDKTDTSGAKVGYLELNKSLPTQPGVIFTILNEKQQPTPLELMWRRNTTGDAVVVSLVNNSSHKASRYYFKWYGSRNCSSDMRFAVKTKQEDVVLITVDCGFYLSMQSNETIAQDHKKKIPLTILIQRGS